MNPISYRHFNFVNQLDNLINFAYMSKYLPCILDLSIETFFVDHLNDDVIKKIERKHWNKAFIKNDIFSLEGFDNGKSIWPDTKISEMIELYKQVGYDGQFAIRKYIDREIIEQEERYWVFNGNIYHRTNFVPNVVKEAAKRLNKLGSKYYTIDATTEFVVEVNPGESSDRHAVNSAELFASWIKKEFVVGK